jgi:hypothetical protein
MFKRYNVSLTLLRDQLGTNPCDPAIMDTHIINKQRKLILEKSEVNSTINKYLDALPITAEKGEAELNALFAKIEELTGAILTPQERIDAVAGKLDSLKETLKSMENGGMTVFFWNNEKDLPMIGDHMIYGFLKGAAEALIRALPKGESKNGTVMKSASYTQSLINQHVRCETQFITFDKDLKRNAEGGSFTLQRSLRAMTAKGPRVSIAKSEVVPAGAKLNFTLKVLNGSQITLAVLKELFSYGEMTGLGQWRNAGYGMFTAEVVEAQG